MNKFAIISLMTMTLSACSADREVVNNDDLFREPASAQKLSRVETNKLLDSFPDEQPIGVVNFFKFNKFAQYTTSDPEFGTAATNISGREAFDRYLSENNSIAENLGVKIVFVQDYRQIYFGQDDIDWDVTMLLYYPTKTALKALMGSEEFRFGARHRKAATSEIKSYHIDGRGLEGLPSTHQYGTSKNQ